MEKNPYKFSQTNERLVVGVQKPGMVAYGTAAVFLGSVYLYNRRFFRIDGNSVNMLAFVAASLPASYAYANFLFNSAETEAALINNQRENWDFI